MTKKETAEIMAIINAAYPQFYGKQSDADKIAALRLWYMHFKNVSYAIMLQAVHAVIAENKFQPTIADVNEKIDLIVGAITDLSSDEAWAAVERAIHASDHTAAFNRLPPLVRRVVGSAEQLDKWANMDECTVFGVPACIFHGKYSEAREKQKENMHLPQVREQYLAEQMQYIEANGLIGLPTGE